MKGIFCQNVMLQDKINNIRILTWYAIVEKILM